jgi:hypothetical protein
MAIATVVLAIAALAAFNVNMNMNSKSGNLSDMALANMEALAEGELNWGVGKWIVTVYTPTRWNCSSGGGVCCPSVDSGC